MAQEKRVVVVESPDRRFFEQAIFIVRSDAQEGVTARELVEQAREVARSYAADSGRLGRVWRRVPPGAYALVGGGVMGLVWILATSLGAS